jgi:hypothetical protein
LQALLAASFALTAVTAGMAAAKEANPETRSIDSAPRHLVPGICRLVRTHQIHARGAKADEGWTDEGGPETRIWLDSGPTVPCKTAGRSVRLVDPMPSPDVISLLKQQTTLLEHARLLFAGNTRCARQRAYPFTLDAMALAPAEKGAEAMYLLSYASDRNTTARITIRKNRNAFDAWNVDCSD